jgi:UDP-glucose 4-epimerase
MKKIKKKLVLVTGGCGFVGSHVVDNLIEKNYLVVVLDNLSTGTIKNLNKNAIFHQGDVSDELFVNNIFKQYKFDYVIHQAAKINTNVLHEETLLDIRNSVNSTVILAKNCLKYKVKNLVFASSVAVYGRCNNLPAKENTNLSPIYSYGIAKVFAELYLKYYKTYYNLNYQILRYANVYGPRQPIFGEVGVIAIYTERLLSGKKLIIYGDGSNQRDYIYVSDIVEFTIQSMELKYSSIYNVGRGIAVSINDVFAEFQTNDKKKQKAILKPERFGEIGNFYSDINNALKTGWKPKVSLKEGVYKTINFYSKIKK